MKRRNKTKVEKNCGSQNLKGSARSDQLLIAGLLVIILVSAVVIGSVLHSWKKQYRGAKEWTRDANVENLQTQINVLKKEIAKNKAGSANIVANQKASVSEASSAVFEKAVNDKDFTKIEALIADRIYFVEDATECCGNITKKEAVSNLKKYIAGAKTFNFDQTQQVVKQLKVNLADTFAKYSIGIGDNKMVLSYHLDKQGKVDDLMLSASHLMYDLE